MPLSHHFSSEDNENSINFFSHSHLQYNYVALSVIIITSQQWRTQKIFIVGVHSVAYGGHLYLVCAVCDVMI